MTAEKAQISARIDPDLKAKVELAAWRERKSVTQWLTEAMQDKLKANGKSAT